MAETILAKLSSSKIIDEKLAVNFTIGFHLYGLCLYGFGKSNASLVTLYCDAYYEFRAGLWHCFGVFYHWWQRKNECRILYWSLDYCDYGDLKWYHQTLYGKIEKGVVKLDLISS